MKGRSEGEKKRGSEGRRKAGVGEGRDGEMEGGEMRERRRERGVGRADNCY